MKKKKSQIIIKLYSALLSVYIVGLLWLVPTLIRDTYHIKYGFFKVFVAIVLTVIVYFCLIKGYEKFTYGIELHKGINKKKYNLWFLIGLLTTFIIMIIYFYGFFPGSFTSDNIQQWEQVQSGHFLDWHPVFHTYFIFLLSLFINHYGFVVFIHIVLFSIACGYLLRTLAKWGFPNWCMILSEALIILNPMTRHLFIGLLKDATFSICIMILTTFLINVLLSKGSWLNSKKNIIAFSMFIVLLSIIRHNGIFLTIPLMLLMFCILSAHRKRIFISSMIILLIIMVIKYPFYNLLNVERPDNQFSETMGLPMTVLCNIKVLEPDRLTTEANEAMNIVGYKEEVWKNYQLGNFNSIKWQSGACGYLANVDRKLFMKMAVEMMVKEPELSLQAVYQLTRMVWDVRGDVHWEVVTGCYKNQWNYEWKDQSKDLRNILIKMDTATWTKMTKYIFAFTGVYILLLLVVGLLSMKRFGLSVLFLILPILCYDFGTMLLLCGTDYRFFHFNSMIIIPLCLAMLIKQK